ncbi:MAG: hypothetical protein MJ137_05365 [Clostridia bacterium]|nr:hypothetical protein [Clostridia bacterium]
MRFFNLSNPKSNKKKKRFGRAAVFTSALVSAALLSSVVFAAVTYDSSKDPVVAYSAMTQYVTGQLEGIRNTLSSLESRLAVVELTGGGSGSGTGTGSGISGEGAAQLLSRLTELENGLNELKKENQTLKTDLDNAKKELNSLISSLQTEIDTLKNEITDISGDISSLQSSLSSAKSDISTLKTDFKQISDISTKLNTVTYKVNVLTGDNGDIAKLKKELADITATYDDVLEKAGRLYNAVLVPYGATVIAENASDTAMLILRSGSAVAVSPFNTPGTAQGLNDLSDGSELYDGANIPLFHNIMIPRGGDDGRGVRVTSIGGAYIMIGGNYTIVEPQ